MQYEFTTGAYSDQAFKDFKAWKHRVKTVPRYFGWDAKEFLNSIRIRRDADGNVKIAYVDGHSWGRVTTKYGSSPNRVAAAVFLEIARDKEVKFDDGSLPMQWIDHIVTGSGSKQFANEWVGIPRNALCSSAIECWQKMLADSKEKLKADRRKLEEAEASEHKAVNAANPTFDCGVMALHMEIIKRYGEKISALNAAASAEQRELTKKIRDLAKTTKSCTI